MALRAALLAIPARVRLRSPHLDAKDLEVFDAEICSELEALVEDREFEDRNVD